MEKMKIRITHSVVYASNRVASSFHWEEHVDIAVAPAQAAEPGGTGVIGGRCPETAVMVVARGEAPPTAGIPEIGAYLFKQVDG
jgi:hypothetical protein